jgi:hypothetical protein
MSFINLLREGSAAGLAIMLELGEGREWRWQGSRGRRQILREK